MSAKRLMALHFSQRTNEWQTIEILLFCLFSHYTHSKYKKEKELCIVEKSGKFSLISLRFIMLYHRCSISQHSLHSLRIYCWGWLWYSSRNIYSFHKIKYLCVFIHLLYFTVPGGFNKRRSYSTKSDNSLCIKWL